MLTDTCFTHIFLYSYHPGKFESELPVDDEGFWTPRPMQEQRDRKQEEVALPHGAEKKAKEKKCLFFFFTMCFPLKTIFFLRAAQFQPDVLPTVYLSSQESDERNKDDCINCWDTEIK